MIQRFALTAVLIHVMWPTTARSAPSKAPSAVESVEVRVAFGKDCKNLLLEEIGKAQTRVQVAVYTITHPRIVDALTRAARQGVNVIVKYDTKQAELERMQEAIKRLKKDGVSCIPVVMSHEQACMHHKFVVIDEDRVLTGSYNFTSSASTMNYENLVLMRSPAVAKEFAMEFESIKSR